MYRANKCDFQKEDSRRDLLKGCNNNQQKKFRYLVIYFVIWREYILFYEDIIEIIVL